MDDQLKHKLAKFLKLFEGRPYTLAHLLLKNSIITEVFKRKLEDSSVSDSEKHFDDFQKMLDYYDFLFDTSKFKKKRSKDWNSDLNRAILEQRYEDAAEIRDHMLRNKIKIII